MKTAPSKRTLLGLDAVNFLIADVLSVPPRASSWELVFVSILTMGALIGMLWPLF